MPNIASAKKALRQSIRRRKKNLQQKTDLKKSLKQFKKLVAEKKLAEAQTALSCLYKLADKAAKTRVIKKNKAIRIKSRAAKFAVKSRA